MWKGKWSFGPGKECTVHFHFQVSQNIKATLICHVFSELRLKLNEFYTKSCNACIKQSSHHEYERAELTGTPSMWDSWSAFFCRKQLPALVTKTTGTRNCPFASTSFWKALFAAGMGVFPRTKTPSMSNSNPKLGSDCWGDYNISMRNYILQCLKEMKNTGLLLAHDCYCRKSLIVYRACLCFTVRHLKTDALLTLLFQNQTMPWTLRCILNCEFCAPLLPNLKI